MEINPDIYIAKLFINRKKFDTYLILQENKFHF